MGLFSKAWRFLNKVLSLKRGRVDSYEAHYPECGKSQKSNSATPCDCEMWSWLDFGAREMARILNDTETKEIDRKEGERADHDIQCEELRAHSSDVACICEELAWKDYWAKQEGRLRG